ncbi:GNAT family N-acetyltransferase [Ferroacidibacillus organovorans]|nr:GNAT family N-acetyltransferase [Ferroacidibacillus organovorans]
MNFTTDEINRERAIEIANWSYGSPYDFYNIGVSEEAIAELMNGSYRAVYSDDWQMIGFYCTGDSAQVATGHALFAYDHGGDEVIDFGLGMRPDWTGKGRGSSFLAFVLAVIVANHPGHALRLTVAVFNQRAIRLYQKFGFRTVIQFDRKGTLFQTMKMRDGDFEKIRVELQIQHPQTERDRMKISELWEAEWGGDRMVSRGHVYRLPDLIQRVAKVEDALVGATTYRLDDNGGCELMSLNALRQGIGIGTALLHSVEDEAKKAGCRRVWLITSNDNLEAIRFYQRRGYRITAVYPGAIDQARSIKPAIPHIGDHGIEIHDEIELAKSLTEV